MIQRIKKSLFVSSTILLGILYPFISSAGWVDNLKKGIGTYILFLIIKLAVNIAKFFTGLTGSLLNWVLSPNFISYSYTNPGGPKANPIIETGLGVTQGFVNMLLVLILVYIAIATILRLAGYETKKLLITFIIVALLVNFAPVICGLIVDASNIVMNFFIQDLKADAFGATMVRSVEQISAGFDERTEVESAWPFITQLAVMVPFLWVLTFILLLFTVIFILRYLVIWLLVILSPLAFACYILPITRKYFDRWWEQFINWSFIGVSCGFFLYLGLLLVTRIQAGAAVSIPSTAGNAVFNGILPYFVSAIFLGIGFVFGLQTSAIGASTVVNFAKARDRGTLRGTAKSAGWVAKKSWKGMALADRKFIPKVLSKDEEGKRRFLQLTTARHAAEGITKTWDRTKFLRWFRPEPLRKFSEFRVAMDEAKKQNTGPSDIGMERLAYGKLAPKEAAAWLDTAVRDRGDSQDFVKAYAKKYGYWNKKTKKVDEEGLFKDKRFLNDKYAKKALDFMSKTGNLGKVLRMDSRLAKIGKSKEAGRKKMIESIINAKPSDIANMEREVIDNEEVMEIVMAVCGENQLRAFGNLKGGVMARQDTVNNIISKWVEKKKLDPTKEKENWDKYMDHLSKKYNVSTPGIAKAVTNERFTSLGWEEHAKYKTSVQRATPSGTSVGAVVLGKVEKEVEKLRSIGERKPRVLEDIPEKKARIEKEEQKLKNITEKRKRKK